ncbi:NUDIX family hydrolase [Karstenula rhodostoma CBS 690.94]|uniref:NUDIX family hydrolase n=1 Tax=Karstenula rhodostoma CBS 690.94 TaxID=1392251 RepID=A0A9P4UEY7_9PLEO|nr:NUDIX family hydrolase [Karstenula rhodostoma CBS 690.94]
MDDTTAGASPPSEPNLESFSLPGWDNTVPVTHDSGITQSQILNFRGFDTWQKTLQSSLKRQKFSDHEFNADPYELKSIEIQSYDLVGRLEALPHQKRPLFIKLRAKVENAKGEDIPAVVFLRGGSVAVLIIVRPTDSLDERYVIMTEQARIPAGSLSFMEIPAGMIDPKDDSFGGTAARELEEEVGLKLKEQDLINMTELALKGHETEESLQNAMYPSPGGCDEFISIYLWEKEMDRMQIDGLRGKLGGERSEREHIRIRLLNYEKLLQVGARDGKTLAAWSLYEYLKRTRQIK